MKKCLRVFVSAALLFTAAGCGSSAGNSQSSDHTAGSETAAAPVSSGTEESYNGFRFITSDEFINWYHNYNPAAEYWYGEPRRTITTESGISIAGYMSPDKQYYRNISLDLGDAEKDKTEIANAVISDLASKTGIGFEQIPDGILDSEEKPVREYDDDGEFWNVYVNRNPGELEISSNNALIHLNYTPDDMKTVLKNEEIKGDSLSRQVEFTDEASNDYTARLRLGPADQLYNAVLHYSGDSSSQGKQFLEEGAQLILEDDKLEMAQKVIDQYDDIYNSGEKVSEKADNITVTLSKSENNTMILSINASIKRIPDNAVCFASQDEQKMLAENLFDRMGFDTDAQIPETVLDGGDGACVVLNRIQYYYWNQYPWIDIDYTATVPEDFKMAELRFYDLNGWSGAVNSGKKGYSSGTTISSGCTEKHMHTPSVSLTEIGNIYPDLKGVSSFRAELVYRNAAGEQKTVSADISTGKQYPEYQPAGKKVIDTETFTAALTGYAYPYQENDIIEAYCYQMYVENKGSEPAAGDIRFVLNEKEDVAENNTGFITGTGVVEPGMHSMAYLAVTREALEYYELESIDDLETMTYVAKVTGGAESEPAVLSAEDLPEIQE